MDNKEILGHVDHTLLTVTAKKEDIMALVDDAIHYKVASVCIAPYYASFAKEYGQGKVPVCTVVGFPNGSVLRDVKAFEAETYLKAGADEIDMVINLSMVKNKEFDAIKREIEMVKSKCKDHILKVIVETCLLTEDEKIKLCQIVSKSGADYIKTSTGFSSGGATKEDIQLFAANVEKHVKIKAAGGIQTLEDAIDFLNLGADRLGTSRIVKLIKNEQSPKDAY